jgi:TatA/E family protein of Tat protein translocase
MIHVESTRPIMLSLPHLIIIFVVALIVFGPEKLPQLARDLGKIMAEFRRATGGLRFSLEENLRELEREVQARHTPAPQPPPQSVPANPPVQTPATAAELDAAPGAAAPVAEIPANTEKPADGHAA